MYPTEPADHTLASRMATKRPLAVAGDPARRERFSYRCRYFAP